MLKELIDLFHQYPVRSTIFATTIASAFVGAFPAPTKDSGIAYIVWFKFSNTVIGNFKRAQSTALESSPNWQDAVEKHNAENGLPSLDRVPPQSKP